jgi:ATP-binding cassette subfamily B protein
MIGSGVAALAATLAGLAIPLVTQRIVDGPIAHHETGALIGLIVVVALLGIAEALLIRARRVLVAMPVSELENRMRRDLFAHLQRLPMAFHDRWQSGQLLSRATNDLSVIRRFLAFGGIYLVVNAVTVVTGVGILLVMAWPLGLVLAAATAPLIALSYRYESRFKVVARLAQDQAGDLATMVEESVLGVRVLKAFGRGPHIGRRFTVDARRLLETELWKLRVMASLWAVVISLPELAIGALLAVGAVGAAHGWLTLGQLIAAVTLTTYLRWPIDAFGWLLAEANNAASAAERYWEVRDIRPDITDPEHPVELPDPVVGRVRFEGVGFRFPSDEGGSAGRVVLRDVDLDLRPGETVALVGVTGSGKTVLTSLIPRLADATEGRITLDGIDVRELRLDRLRQVVACAFEEPVLFSASVRENVALGVRDASDDDVRTALRIAHATDFVDALPWGLDTRIGEQGLSLSGGQRQRLALARAVLGRPAVLVLDDPLSALDVHTEAEVEQALRQVLREVTALVVAHRPSTVQLADRVALLSGGRITAVGTHERLMAKNTEYRAVLSTMDDEPSHPDRPAERADLESREVLAR